MTRVRPLLAAAALAAAGLAAAAPASAQDPESCTVAFIVDGDTFNCADGTTVRLLLVNAAEGGRFGEAARRALATLVPKGSVVRIEPGAKPRDGQGRLRAFVYLPDGRLVNQVLIRLGYAFFEPDPPNTAHVDDLRAAENRARRERLGVWTGG